MQSPTSAIDAPEVKRFERELTALIPHMRAFARSLCRDPTRADDLAQDALAKAWQGRDSFQPGTNLKGWVFMILRNQFYSEARRSWRSTSLDPALAAETLVAVDNPTAAVELDELRRAMDMLPAPQREALILVGAAGLTYEDAAEITSLAIGTLKSRVSRARTRLVEIMAEGRLDADGVPPHAAMELIGRQAAAYVRGAAS